MMCVNCHHQIFGHPITLKNNKPQRCVCPCHNAASNLLDENPNVYIDFSARLDELGRQPYSSKEFFIRHQDRIIFGTDMPANWPDYLDAILRAPITDAQKVAILGGNAAKILRI